MSGQVASQAPKTNAAPDEVIEFEELPQKIDDLGRSSKGSQKTVKRLEQNGEALQGLMAQPALSITSSPSVDVPVPMPVTRPDYDPRRLVHRVLQWYHIFFISLSGTLGVGLYIQTGAILRLGGPWVLLVSVIILFAIVWAVMQCITEMLCIWPISGALYEYVSEFVDPDIGTAVGVLYWFNNSMGFAAIIIAAYTEVRYWSTEGWVKGVLFICIPLALIGLNACGVRVYAWIEIFGGTLKLCFVGSIIFATLAMVFGAGNGFDSHASEWDWGHFDHDAASNQATAFFRINMCLPIVAFSFVGVEITAATALEARADTALRTIPVTSLKLPAISMPWVIGGIYFLASLMLALKVDPSSPSLPSQGWVDQTNSNSPSKSSSSFVQAAESAGLQPLASVFTAFIFITAISAANTELYVASRTLFSLTRESPSGWVFFGRTNRQLVPLRAVFLSTVFSFIPFLSYIQDGGVQNEKITSIFDILSTTSSVSCIMVWAFQCWAFIRFYYCLKRHRERLNNEIEFKPTLRRFFTGAGDNYSWKSHLQPATAIGALSGCLFILIVANSASTWSGFYWQPFLSSWLAPLCFVILVIVLKSRRKIPLRKWKFLVNLDMYVDVYRIFKRLQDIRDNSIPRAPEDPMEAAVVT